MKTPLLFEELVAGGTFTLSPGDVLNPGFGYVARLETFAGVLRTRGTTPIAALVALEVALGLGIPFTPVSVEPHRLAPRRASSDWTAADEAAWKRAQESGLAGLEDFVGLSPEEIDERGLVPPEAGPVGEERTMLSRGHRGPGLLQPIPGWERARK